jgi:hypothetical protein
MQARGRPCLPHQKHAPDKHLSYPGMGCPAYRMAVFAFSPMKITWRPAHKIMQKRIKNTCIRSKTTPLLAVRDMTHFPNTLCEGG